MPEWIMKLSHSGGQARITVPKDLVSEMGWEDVKIVVLQKISPKYLGVRRFEVGKEKDARSERDRFGGDR